ncbi:MAG: RES family NAD+ phosphorylase [Actinomycetota bacterium]|nr:RES family NAD+ phosphorylase [Actinomycetota bacterium]
MVELSLVERVEALGSRPFSGRAWRHVRPQYPPLSGEGARAVGGRWNPPGSFPTLYLGLDVGVVTAEFYRHLARLGLRAEDVLPRVMYLYDVRLSRVLDLRSPETWTDLGLTADRIRGRDQRHCQAVSDAAHYLGMEGLIAPSAAGEGEILVIFLDRQAPESALHVGESETWTVPPESERS